MSATAQHDPLDGKTPKERKRALVDQCNKIFWYLRVRGCDGFTSEKESQIKFIRQYAEEFFQKKNLRGWHDLTLWEIQQLKLDLNIMLYIHYTTEYLDVYLKETLTRLARRIK